MRVFIWIVIGLMAIIIMGDYVPEDKGIVYQVVSGIGLVFVAISVDKMIHRKKNMGALNLFNPINSFIRCCL